MPQNIATACTICDHPVYVYTHLYGYARTYVAKNENKWEVLYLITKGKKQQVWFRILVLTICDVTTQNTDRFLSATPLE
jgi:hypothetical protein